MGEPVSTYVLAAREELGLARDDLARLGGLSVERLADIEGGEEASFDELAALSRVLGVELDLYDEDEDEAPEAREPVRLLLKSARHYIEPRDWRSILDAAEVAEQITSLERWRGLTPRYESLRRDFSTDARIEEPIWREGQRLADRVRQRLGLGDQPVPSMYELCDELGIVVIEALLPQGIAGFCLADEQHGVAVVLDVTGGDDMVLARRFALAHELCHVLFDRHELQGIQHFDPPGWAGRDKQDVDIRADAFAIYFLAPARALKQTWEEHGGGAAAFRAVIETFGVSPSAARHHVCNQGLTTPEQIERFWHQFDSGTPQRFISAERHPSELAPEALRLSHQGPLLQQVRAAFEEGVIGRSKVIELLDIDGDTFERLFRASEPGR